MDVADVYKLSATEPLAETITGTKLPRVLARVVMVVLAVLAVAVEVVVEEDLAVVETVTAAQALRRLFRLISIVRR